MDAIRRKWHDLVVKWGIVPAHGAKSASDETEDNRAGLFARGFGAFLFGDSSLVPAHHERVIASLYQSGGFRAKGVPRQTDPVPG